MDWSSECRLALIREVAAQSYNDPRDREYLMQKIMFLCDMPAKFLEANKDKIEEYHKAVLRGGSVVEL